ncbi:protein root UVB sensitive 4 isoform X2 [Aristolochia californica]|uniref:protein root UVB sensitive 4 isoform X2 n=1 Tax=Aristolochia californica TaxID=171875 RepID=UPI0035E06207
MQSVSSHSLFYSHAQISRRVQKPGDCFVPPSFSVSCNGKSSSSHLPKPQRKLPPSNFLKSSYHYEINEIDGEETAERILPIVIYKSGRTYRYLGDGARLKLVCCESEASNHFGLGDGFRRLLHISGLAVANLFVPQQVQGNYMGYLKWKFLHRVFSSTLQVLATQAMFRAIGFGSHQTLSSAAALNWVLKDGLGRVSRCIYTASLGSAFDTNLKHFLLLATTANIAKSISLAAYLATGSAIHRSFAIADNLGEVSAKAQIQTVCFDNVGLLIAAILNILCKSNQRLQTGLPLFLYPIFSTIDLFSIYQGLQHVHLQTLTKNRLEIVIDRWINMHNVPSPAEVSNEEGIFPGRKGSKIWPIRIGCVNPEDLSARSLRREDFYFICMETSRKGLMRKKQQGVLLCLHERAGTADIIMGLLQACHVRNVLQIRKNRCGGTLGSSDTCGALLREWLAVIDDSKRYAEEEVNLLIDALRSAGWAVKNILLSTTEQIRYAFDDER